MNMLKVKDEVNNCTCKTCSWWLNLNLLSMSKQLLKESMINSSILWDWWKMWLERACFTSLCASRNPFDKERDLRALIDKYDWYLLVPESKTFRSLPSLVNDSLLQFCWATNWQDYEPDESHEIATWLILPVAYACLKD